MRKNKARKSKNKYLLKDKKIKKTQLAKSKSNTSLKDVSYYAGPRAGAGGLYNFASGLGGPNDKSKQSLYLPTRIVNKDELEVISVESWAARKFINFPIDQMFLRAREFEGVSDDFIDKYKAYYDFFNLDALISDAMKAARLYGTALLLFITDEAPLDTPLNINFLRPGDLRNVLLFDRFSINITDRDYDIYSRNYGQPLAYHIYPTSGDGFTIHHTRVIRFDGKKPLTSNPWRTYDRDFGVSELIPVIQSIFQESQAVHGISQLIEEASIGVFKVAGFKEALGAQGAPPDAPSIETLANSVTRTKSIYNSLFLDSTDEFGRLEVNFSGISNVLDRFAFRLAAASDIPATVFLGKSPEGMNATGASDLEINANKVAMDQENKLRPIYNLVDRITQKTSGLLDEFSFYFPSILGVSEEQKADVLLKKAQALSALTTTVQGEPGILSLDEAREILSLDGSVGIFEPREFDFERALEEKREADGDRD